MAHEWDVLPHIVEIKERLASIEANVIEQKNDLKDHSDKSLAMQHRVQNIESKADKVEGSLAVLKWLVPSVPVFITALLKVLDVI